jgi:ABC-type transporter Mla subunit MlaD
MVSSADMNRVLENLDHRLRTVEQILPTLATKADLERFATKTDLEQLKRHTDMRFEDLRDDISKVAEGVASIASTVRANQTTLESVVNRLETHEDVLKALARRHGI